MENKHTIKTSVSVCIRRTVVSSLITPFCFAFYRILAPSETVVMSCVNLTNRFHVAVRLFSSRSQMTSKCGKNKEVSSTRAAGACVSHVFTTF